ncbi:hypothetical protein H072_5041 [Dactylellina haptotyla CBS 200.50]|uniref:[histone H3]-trimethyl-L-lysine(9) demethylase n=1 Tax=Dactylellina haptotyla (strain CBS 200.50) TaxID=1284197 RepID=S8ADH4_DACHA|nr:hypothetical protein H072_5041 [Dactylellina haptotyla CBS 200.50]
MSSSSAEVDAAAATGDIPTGTAAAAGATAPITLPTTDALENLDQQPLQQEQTEDKLLEETVPQSTTDAPPNTTVEGAQEADEDIGEVFPDHYWDNGKVPVFKPTMKQFRSFKKFVEKIDHYGMQSGIVKIIPPQEWRDSLPALDEKVKDIKIKNPIEQHIGGSTGIYRQANLQKQKTYNLPQWRYLCESSEHQPPARRGEKRKNQDTRTKAKARPARTTRKSTAATAADAEPEPIQKPLTPPPGDDAPAVSTPVKEEEPAAEDTQTPSKKGRQPAAKAKRIYVKKTKEELEEAAAEAAEIWNDFDYRMPDAAEFTAERCEELEKHYWRTLNYNSPLYGADMPGSLFEDTTTVWNVAHLENILDCLPEKLPGVNTAYLYLGMWKATFSWHLEDVDLYSINYIHFGAPKQWYSISQEDAPKFHNAMKSIWPTEAKKCDQFLRHKTFLASPSYLDSHFNIKVNKLVHYEGEFVITFPFGYHAGYNLGYNCAESVNFATEAWLDYGRAAKKCECIEDAVWVDANDVERRYRGLPSEDEFFTEEEEEEDGSDDDDPREPLTPPESVEGDEPKKPKRSKSTKKRKSESEGGRMVKKIKVKFSKPPPPVCILCPNNPTHEELLVTSEGKKAHKLCAMYIPETFFTPDAETSEEKISNVESIPPARMQLKCYFCRVKGGACFQCSEKKCVRAYHATCAAAAGVLVQSVVVPETKDESGNVIPTQTELDFRCRFHRPKRSKDHTPEALEEDASIVEFAKKLSLGDIVQAQLYLGEIFAGRVLENRATEQMLLVEVLPKKFLFEFEWKYLLCSSIMKTAPAARTSKARVSLANVRSDSKGKRVAVEPRKTDFYANTPNVGDQFLPETTKFSWVEFIRHPLERNPFQEPAIKIWYYIAERSTENIPSWTKDPAVREPDKDAFEPHLQRRSGQGEGPCYPTQAEENARRNAAMLAQQRQAAYFASQQQMQQQQQQNANRPQVPQPLHTTNWRQPPPPQPAGPIASTSSGQKFVVASAKGAAGKRVFYCPLQPTNYQHYQTTPHRVSYTSNNTGARVRSPASAAGKAAAAAAAAAVSTPTIPSPATATPPRPVAHPANNDLQTAAAQPNVTVQPTPLSGATPS